MPTTTSHVLLLCVYVGKNFAKFKPITIVIAPTMLGGNNLLIKSAPLVLYSAANIAYTIAIIIPPTATIK